MVTCPLLGFTSDRDLRVEIQPHGGPPLESLAFPPPLPLLKEINKFFFKKERVVSGCGGSNTATGSARGGTKDVSPPKTLCPPPLPALLLSLKSALEYFQKRQNLGHPSRPTDPEPGYQKDAQDFHASIRTVSFSSIDCHDSALSSNLVASIRPRV